MSILKSDNLCKTYGSGENEVKALDHLSISIEEGSFISIIGTSGSGKSTLLNMLGGLDRPDSGTVTVAGKEIFSMSDEQLTVYRRRNIGFVFQNYNLVPILNVYENIVLPIELDGSEVDKKFVKDIIGTLGIEKKLTSMPNQLSGGQQQRVAIARAMVKNPRLLLCDELTGALDTKSSKQVLRFVEQMNRQFGTTIVIITHNEAIAGMADRIVRLKDGKVVENSENSGKIPAKELSL